MEFFHNQRLLPRWKEKGGKTFHLRYRWDKQILGTSLYGEIALKARDDLS